MSSKKTTHFDTWLKVAAPNDIPQALELLQIGNRVGEGQRYTRFICDGRHFIKDLQTDYCLILASRKAQHAFRTTISDKLNFGTLIQLLPPSEPEAPSLREFL